MLITHLLNFNSAAGINRRTTSSGRKGLRFSGDVSCKRVKWDLQFPTWEQTNRRGKQACTSKKKPVLVPKAFSLPHDSDSLSLSLSLSTRKNAQTHTCSLTKYLSILVFHFCVLVVWRFFICSAPCCMRSEFRDPATHLPHPCELLWRVCPPLMEVCLCSD